MNDFERVAKIIRYLDSNRAAQPRLSSLAAAAGLSEFHFHRLFHRWAGVTPKDFLQALTVEHAKQRLRASASVLDAALDTGLSGPGRLHDLLVTLEAASPGEFRTGGRGLSIEWGSATSPFGACTVGWNARGLCHLAFCDSESLSQPPRALVENWPNANCRRNDSEAQRRAAHIFQRGNSAPTSLRAVVRGTEFQLRVWRALLEIPEGAVVSYHQLARAIGRPRAARAVGAACGANPIAYLIPCHRVIRETGVVQGYRWGTERKRALLAWESTAAPALAVSPPRSKLPAHA